MSISEQQVDYIDNLTQQQASCLVWFEQRAGRITGSVAHDVLHTKMEDPAPSLMKKICTVDPTPIQAEAVQYGRNHENDAINQYDKFMQSKGHTNFKVEKTGMKLSRERPHIVGLWK